MKKITLLMLIAFMTITTQAQNKLLSSIREYYSNNTWEKSYGYNYEYDSNNNLITKTYLYWDSNSAVWETVYKTTYTYNASNKVTQELSYEWNSSNNQFDLEWKTIYTYVNNKLTEREEFEWTGGGWESDEKITITYNNNLPDVATERLRENGQWIDYRTKYTYNTNNIVISSVEERWLGAQWVNIHKTVYTYDANNKLTLSRGADWDDFNGNWAQNGDKIEYEWDATGNKTQYIDYYSYGGNNYQYEEDYTYDTTKLMSNFSHPFKDKTGFDYFGEGGFPYVNKLLTETSNEGTSRTTYNYNTAITLSTDTFEKEVATITVYPNPTQDFLNIQNESNTEIDTITVIDLTGKKVLEQNNSTQVDVQNLAKGVYVLEVISDKNKETTKFIKE